MAAKRSDLMGRNTIIAVVLLVGLGWGFWWSILGSNSSGDAIPADGPAIVSLKVPETISDQAQLGKLAFDNNCAVCHGENAAGRDGAGPPLVHKIYEPGHHGDASFLLAAKNGVRAHHWRFGNMPPVKDVTEGDIKMIVAYVRELQRANGIH